MEIKRGKTHVQNVRETDREERRREREFGTRERKTEQKTRRTSERKRVKSYDTEISNLICRYQRYL